MRQVLKLPRFQIQTPSPIFLVKSAVIIIKKNISNNYAIKQFMQEVKNLTSSNVHYIVLYRLQRLYIYYEFTYTNKIDYRGLGTIVDGDC